MPAFHTMTPDEIKSVAEQMSRDQQPALWEKIDVLTTQLAESQAREAAMREAVTAHEKECRRSVGWVMFYDATLHRVVLALPHDDTALKARLKAERERCAKFVQEHAAFIDEDGDRITSAGNAILADAIRNLGDE